MKINLNNYEAFYLDYLEGNLDQSALLEFESFLEINPTLKVNFLPEEITSLVSYPIKYPNKLSLKKFEFKLNQLSKSTFDDFSIAYYEHLLTDDEERVLLDFIKSNPKYSIAFELYGKTYLKPQLTTTFENKKVLYQHKAAKRTLYPVFKWVSIAAGMALLVSVYLKYYDIKPVLETKPLTSNKTDNTKNSIGMTPPDKVKFKTASNNVKSQFNKLSSKSLSNRTSSNNLGIDTIISDIKMKDTMQIAFMKPINAHDIDVTDYVTKEDLQIMFITSPALSKFNKPITITEYALLQIKNNLSLEKVEDSKGKISFFKILQAGIRGYNQLTDSNLQLTSETNEVGKMTALSFKTEAGLFQIHHRSRK